MPSSNAAKTASVEVGTVLTPVLAGYRLEGQLLLVARNDGLVDIQVQAAFATDDTGYVVDPSVGMTFGTVGPGESRAYPLPIVRGRFMTLSAVAASGTAQVYLELVAFPFARSPGAVA